MTKIEFSTAKIANKKAKDRATFESSSDNNRPHLYIYTPDIIPCGLGTSTITIDVYIRRLGDPENIKLPIMDVKHKLLKFMYVQNEDELVIAGNEYEICKSGFGPPNNYDYEWYLNP